MTPSIYDLKDAEIANARRFRREAIGNAIGTAALAAVAVAWLLICAVA